MSPNHSVADGKCDICHNLRFSGGAWRNVHHLHIAHDNIHYNPVATQILYKHPATADNRYIVKKSHMLAYESVSNAWLYYALEEEFKVGSGVYDDEYALMGIVTEVVSETSGLLTIKYKNDAGTISEVKMYRVEGDDELPKVYEAEVVGDSSKSFRHIQDLVTGEVALHKLSVSHFGKILIVSDLTSKEMLYYAFDGARYKHIDLNPLECKFSFTYATKPSPDVEVKFVDTTGNFDAQIQYGFEGKGVAAYEKVCNETKSEWYFRDFIEEDNVWRGEIAIFLALRDESGEIIYRSAPRIINSAQEDGIRKSIPTTESLSSVQPLKDNKYYAYAGWKTSISESSITQDQLRTLYTAEYHQFIRVDLDINYNVGDSSFVKDIAIYSTRLYSLLERKPDSFTNTKDLMQEPFYLMDVINVDTVKGDGSVEYKISYSQLKNIEQKTLFTPTISSVSLFSERMLEYNNRLHLISPYTKVPSFVADSLAEGTSGARYAIFKREKDNASYYFKWSAPQFFPARQWQMISVPSKVSDLYLCNVTDVDNQYAVLGQLKMKYAAHLDYSYYIALSTQPLRKYDYLDTSTNVQDKYIEAAITTHIQTTNRIQASESNNCFVYPYQNSYHIGSETSTIVAANSAAIEMSDAKFGEFPLYVFTDEGVFSMQSGSGGTLYSAVVPISYDKAINPNTLAVNYNVLFVTEQGIMALSRQGSSVISVGLNNADNTIPEWMRTTKMLHAPQHNEVIATDKDNDLLYIYSLDNQVWSTKDLHPGRVLNNGELVEIGEEYDSYNIVDLLKETSTDSPTAIALSTRAIKLGSMELKRLETFVLRFESQVNQTITVRILGSTDTVNWIPFREVKVFTNRDILIRRVPMSAKYFKVEVTSTVSDDIKIIAIEMEYYLRMLHRLR